MYNNMALKKANRHGEVSEWSIVPSWKGGVPQGTAGSNPVLSATAKEPAISAGSLFDSSSRNPMFPRTVIKNETSLQ